jgi:copper resistance protein C
VTANSEKHMRSLPRIAIFLFLTRYLTDPNAAWAHAIIVSSSPAAGATVAGNAVSIRLRFNSRIDHARSRLTLFAPDGAPQALTPTTDSPADELDAEANLLSTGAWRLRWQVLSVDGHITRGDIPFTVH